MRVSVPGRLAMALLPLVAGAGPLCADVELSLVSTAPSRPHLVAAGTSTTFVLAARNTADDPVTVTVAIRPAAAALRPAAAALRLRRRALAVQWQPLLFSSDAVFRKVGAGSEETTLALPGQATVNLVAQLTASSGLPEGSEGRAIVTAVAGGTTQGMVELKARVRNRPKVYYVAIDGAGRGYLQLTRKGRPLDGTAEPLMPRSLAFAARAARMDAAKAVLPATTDPNHGAALTGSWPGTFGVFSVRKQYLGRDAAGRAVVIDGNRSLLRFGADGQRIQTVFDVAKDPASGGTPDAFNALISGKRWFSRLMADDGRTVDLIGNGREYPFYVPPPQSFRLGDPPSDDDPDRDREGTNLGPRPIKKLFNPTSWGSIPEIIPEDRWITEQALRVIAAEDPDVLYVLLADADTVQHTYGAADRSEEWSDPGTPNVLWDDENMYNRNANRDPVLDVVYEADFDFGLITDQLEARGVLDRSYVVLLSDHGLSTVMNTKPEILDPGKMLLEQGVNQEDVEWMVTSGEMGWIALADPSKRDQIEALLENHQQFHPVLGTSVSPYVVLNREEMDSGVDTVEGAMTEDGVLGNSEGELYSQWCIEVPPDGSKVRWPDLFIFTRERFQTTLAQSRVGGRSFVGAPFNGVHGSSASADVLLAMSGPGIRPGLYGGAASLVDIAPTLYHLNGVAAPANVDGRVLHEILVP